MASADVAIGRRGPSRTRRLRRGYSRYWFAYAMLAPVAFVLLLLVILPLFKGIQASFTNVSATTSGTRFDPVTLKEVPLAPKSVGLDNYPSVLRSAEFHHTLVWT